MRSQAAELKRPEKAQTKIAVNAMILKPGRHRESHTSIFSRSGVYRFEERQNKRNNGRAETEKK